MDDTIRGLTEIIKSEEQLLKDFLEHLEEQKKILVTNDVEAFETSVQKQELMINQIKKLEKRRIEWVQKLAQGKSINASQLTMTHLVEMSLGNVSIELKDVKKSIAGIVNRIKRVNQVNQYLIKRSMNRAQHNIDWLIDSTEQDVTYEKSGQLRNRHLQAIIVNKVL